MFGEDKLLRQGRCFLLAYDQGFEHGPTDFNDRNVDPQYIFDIAKNAGVFTCIAVQKGIAEKYYPSAGSGQTGIPPLVVKLNGKTNYHKGEELFSPQNCSIDEAIKLGASGVGYTVYVGSEREEESIKEFSNIQEEAHNKGLPVIMWAYPRGKHIGENDHSPENIAYAARIALELGADFVKLSYTGDIASMKWVVRAAGKTKVLAVGGSKAELGAILTKTEEIKSAGVCGWAMGRNIWQDTDPTGTAKKISEVLFST